MCYLPSYLSHIYSRYRVFYVKLCRQLGLFEIFYGRAFKGKVMENSSIHPLKKVPQVRLISSYFILFFLDHRSPQCASRVALPKIQSLKVIDRLIKVKI